MSSWHLLTAMPQPAGETLQFMQRLWTLVHALDVRSKRMAQTIGVTGPQRLVIRIVGQKPGQTPSDIATILGVHPSTLTGVLARLDERGLIARTVDPDDRRRTRITLTAAGKKTDAERRGTVEAAVRRALARAGESEVTAMLAMVGMIVEELERQD